MNNNFHMVWAQQFVDSLAAQGLADMVISPGSRSTPLALAALSRLRTHVVVDERSAAFFALGQARATGRKTALLCTSGTAGAHYLPAVIEADEAAIPLLVITADRPWEEQACGANQTIAQRDLFGAHVRGYLEVGEPVEGGLNAVARMGAQASMLTAYPTPGPVHVNLRFRLPLEPDGDWTPTASASTPHTSIPRLSPDKDAVDAVAKRIARHPKGLIACGPLWCGQDARDLAAAAAALARASGFPIITGVTGPAFDDTEVPVLRNGAALVQSPAFFERHAPDLVIEVNRPLVSSAYLRGCAQAGVEKVVVTPWRWTDPSSRCSHMVLGPVAPFLRAVADRSGGPGGNQRMDGTWAKGLHALDKAADALPSPGVDLAEDGICRVLGRLDDTSTLLLGNSLTVRDMDTFSPPIAARVLHQRGASGIDGFIAGGAGIASVATGPVVVAIGDMSARHDISSLALWKNPRVPLVLLIVNNRGGRIFEQLPIGKVDACAPALEQAFVLPADDDFRPFAAAYGIPCRSAATEAGLAEAVSQALAAPGATIIEARVTEPDSRRWRRNHAQAVERLIRDTTP